MPDQDPDQPQRRRLVLGGSGAVGRFLLRRLQQGGMSAEVLSRRAPPRWASGWDALQWRKGSLEQELPPVATALPIDLLSAGPLDALAARLQRSTLPAGSRIVALSSMSVLWKAASPNPAERRLAARLAAAERQLGECAAAQGTTLALLRPTLIYGAGIDRSLTPLLQRARRWHRMPWPASARGLRQPVHADDVAAALLAARGLDRAVLPLPGADVLPYDQLLDRLLELASAQRLPLPTGRDWLRRLATRDDRVGAAAAAAWRAGEPQIAPTDGWLALQLIPRGFAPRPEDFVAW